MTEQQNHPLTAEIICEITCVDTDLTHEQYLDRIEDMRAAYDKGAAHKMEQVIQFLEANKDLSVETALRFIGPAMRPQQQEDS